MAKLINLLFAVCIVCFAKGKHFDKNNIKQVLDELQAKEHFEVFIEEYDKNYETDEEYNKRFEIFRENLKDINRRNAESTDTVFGINKFTDLTFEEFISRYTCLKVNNETNESVEYIPIDNVPIKLDYRDKNLVTGIKDQGHCGSCYIFSTIGNIEGQYAKKHGKLVALSEQQALDCDDINYGCKGGYMEYTVKALQQQGGSMAETDYSPYQQIKMQCRTDGSKITAKVTGGGKLGIHLESDVENALAKIGPLAIGVSVCNGWQGYNGGILREKCDKDINHGVVLVGYGSESGTDFWIIKNSWGTTYGEDGYIRVEKGKDLISIGKWVVSAEVA